jgi:hypothetical protein
MKRLILVAAVFLGSALIANAVATRIRQGANPAPNKILARTMTPVELRAQAIPSPSDYDNPHIIAPHHLEMPILSITPAGHLRIQSAFDILHREEDMTLHWLVEISNRGGVIFTRLYPEFITRRGQHAYSPFDETIDFPSGTYTVTVGVAAQTHWISALSGRIVIP